MKSLTCHLIPLFALAGLLVACRAEEPVVAPETPPAEANPDLFYIPGRVSVQFDDATTRMVEEALAQGQPTKVSALDGLLEDLGVKSLRRVFPDALACSFIVTIPFVTGSLAASPNGTTQIIP